MALAGLASMGLVGSDPAPAADADLSDLTIEAWASANPVEAAAFEGCYAIDVFGCQGDVVMGRIPLGILQ
jgi:hypothetical protein